MGLLFEPARDVQVLDWGRLNGALFFGV